MRFTLGFDPGVLQQPEEGDVSSGEFSGVAANVSVAGEVSVILTAGSFVRLNPGSVVAQIDFTVDPSPAPLSCELTSTNVQVLDDVGGEIPVLPRGPRAFAVTWEIIPGDPVVSVGEYLHFSTSLGPSGGVWTLLQAPSGGTINSGNALYHAGPTGGGVVDVVSALMDTRPVQTDVTVNTDPRGPGVVGPATSMDVDGGGLSIADVILILRYVVGLDIPTAEQAAAADFNLSGVPDIGDVINALRIVVGLAPSL
jgi:hypothetical protein